MTWTRSVKAFLLWMTPGVMPLMIIRSGSVTLDAGIDVSPCVVLIAPGGPGCETTAVCADVAELEPLEFVAVTATRW